MIEIHSYHVVKKTTTRIFQSENWENLVVNFKEKFPQMVWVVDEKLEGLKEIKSLENPIVIKGGESVKSQEKAQELIRALALREVDRKTLLIAIGGGSISDLCGYVASIYLRGIAYAVIPSTVLSLIDASIGGKNGINLLDRKNQIGTIYQPAYIVYYSPFLEGLSLLETSDGFAEIIKYGLIQDKSLFKDIKQHFLADFNQNKGFRDRITHSCIIQKSNVVELDPFELDQRRILNFGHTIGHALESLYGYSHGQAVSLGMIFAAKMSESFYSIPTLFSDEIKRTLEQYQLPVRAEKFEAEKIYNKILSDKKKEGQHIFFVLISEIGRANIERIPLEVLRNYIDIAEKERWI